MKLSRRNRWIFASIIGGVIILLTALVAPTGNQLTSGSTYNKFPEGYAAWYAFMEERKTPIQRWKKSFTSLNKTKQSKPIALLRVYGNSIFLIGENEITWVRKGNILIILGMRSPVTEASFSTWHDTPSGEVRIDTTRRSELAKGILLGDSYGAIVWERKIGKGHLIYATTPYLAANAYQENLGNHQFLAELIESYQPRKILVDEYIHGYKDSETEEAEQQEKEGWLAYLRQTPFSLIFVQLLIILLITFWNQNYRLGKPLTLSSPIINNSQAYIDALAALLQKAGKSEFIIETVGKEEQLQLQKKLGLKRNVLDDRALLEAWTQQTKQPVRQLKTLLTLKDRKPSLSDAKLLDWMQKWQEIKDRISKNNQS